MNCPLVYYWGLDSTESARADRLIDYMQNYEHRFPLIEKGISKECAHEILKASGIKRPYLYDLGFRNNNCLGCLKGSMGYWNQIRVHFPEVFKRRAECERIKGYSIVSRRNEDGGITNHWLDELDPRAGWDVPAICDDCGIMCEVYRIEPNVAGDTD